MVGGEFCFEDFVGVFNHGAELVHGEEFAVFTEAFLFEEEGVEVAGEEKENADDDSKGDEGEATEETENDIKKTLDNRVEGDFGHERKKHPG